MKKFLFLLLAVAFFVNCDPKDTPEPKGQLDPNAMIILKPAKGVQLRSTITGLTALEVVQNAVNIKFQSHYFGNVFFDDAKLLARTFGEGYKDYQIPALKMLGIDVITSEGEYYKDLTHAFNVVITDGNNDTIAFVPDAVINNARTLIENAYQNQDFNEVYRIFNEAFTFLPIE
ncbi:Hypothetical protein PEIBARAKI_6666 [Petrimonas sp. IBARAKI]|nr:Hypothetical protein PEIBARAKI_6666 [Petrimonas sp. IBARAKI]